MASRRRKHVDADDLTFASMTDVEGERASKRKASADPIVDPWSRVAAECPCKASADAHRVSVDGIARVHIESRGQPIQCVPGTVIECKPHRCEYAPQPMPERWRKSQNYELAELGGRAS